MPSLQDYHAQVHHDHTLPLEDSCNIKLCLSPIFQLALDYSTIWLLGGRFTALPIQSQGILITWIQKKFFQEETTSRWASACNLTWETGPPPLQSMAIQTTHSHLPGICRQSSLSKTISNFPPWSNIGFNHDNPSWTVTVHQLFQLINHGEPGAGTILYNTLSILCAPSDTPFLSPTLNGRQLSPKVHSQSNYTWPYG